MVTYKIRNGNLKIIAFNGKRDEYNTARQLKDGKNMLTPPRQRLIHNAIQKLSTYNSNRNVDNLLGIAEANKYGLRANSALRRYMEEKSSINDATYENNNWDEELQKATQKAIKKLPKSRREKFLNRYEEVFIQPLEMTSVEKKIIKYRESIINSKPMQEALADKTKASDVSKALKLLDYFIASSETPTQTKAYVLLKLSYMLSDAYSIHNQLKDKKFQVFSEIINDLVIKVPNEDVLTTKNCNQKSHGSCAATSVARKALLYEDKAAYINIILSELDDKPYMYVYDVTRLLEYQKNPEMYEKYRAPKVKVDKAMINYDRALFENYRIIDASALNWMKIAGTLGDGTVSLSDYMPFDVRHNGLFHDSRILLLDDDTYAKEHDYLRVLIKSAEALKDYDEEKTKGKIKHNEMVKNSVSIQKEMEKYKAELIKIFKKSNHKISVLEIKKIFDKFVNYIYVNIQNNDEVLKKQIESVLLQEAGITTKDEKVVSLVREYVKAFKEKEELSVTLKDKDLALSQLYAIGVAQREFLLHQLKVESINKNNYYDEFNLGSYPNQLKNYVSKLAKMAEKQPNSEIIQKLMAKHNMNNKELCVFLNNIHEDLAENILEEIDKNLKIFNIDYKMILIRNIKETLKSHLEGDYSYMYLISDKIKINPDVKNFENMLRKILNKLEKANTYTEMNDIIAILGSQNIYDIIEDNLKNVALNINNQLASQGWESVAKDLNVDKKFENEEELIEFINNTNIEIGGLINIVNVAAKALFFPTEEELIIKLNEQKGEILSSSQLAVLKEKVDAVLKEKDRVKSLQQKGYSVKLNSSLYVYTKEQKQLLDKIEKAIPEFARTIKREYGVVNKLLSAQLDKLYSDIGKRSGHYWNREEGGTGLYNQESVRILEQMTGRPYYVEEDIDKIMNNVKEGKGSGTSGTHVSWSKPAAHAQYIADVATIKVQNPKTGEIEEKEVLLHDNTWGASEKRKYWVAQDGIFRTDYDRNFGPKDGFILEKSLLTGTTLDNFKYDTTIYSENRFKNSTEGPEIEIQESFNVPIFFSAELPGLPPNMERKLEKVLQCLESIIHADSVIEQFFVQIEDPKNNIDVDFLHNIDKLLRKKEKEIMELIVKDDRPMITIEQYNKLDKNHPLKIIIEKYILAKQFPELLFEDTVNVDFGNIRTNEELEAFKKEKLLEGFKQFFRSVTFKVQGEKDSLLVLEKINEELNNVITDIEEKKGIKFANLRENLNNTIKEAFKKDYNGVFDELLAEIIKRTEKTIKADENYKLLTTEEVALITLVARDVTEDEFSIGDIEEYDDKSDLGRFFKFLDNKYNNIDNEDLRRTHRILLDYSKEDFEEVIKDLTFEDMGIKFDTPENIIKLIQAKNNMAHEKLEKVVSDHYYEELMQPANLSADEELNVLYRNLKVKLSEFLGEKFINKYKNMHFKNYRLRPAIPNLEVKNKRELVQMLKFPIENLQTSIEQINSLRKTQNCLHALHNLAYLINYCDVYEQKKEIVEELTNLLNEIKLDKSCVHITENIELLLQKLADNQYNKNTLKSDYNIINLKFLELVEYDSMEKIKDEIKSANKVLTNNIEFLVKSNVLPKYQASVKRLFAKWINLATKDVFNKKEVGDTLKEAMIKLISHHLLTNPQELLLYSVKLAKENKKKESTNLDISVLNVLKSFLVDSYRKVSCIDLEYKLMDMASKGMASKIRDYLNNNVKLTTNQGFLEGGGMSMIRRALQDPSNNNESLILFVEQTGLIDDLLDSIYKDDYKIIKSGVASVCSQFISSTKAKKYLHSMFNGFLAKQQNSKNISKADLEKAMSEYIELLLEGKPEKRIESLVDKYWNDFRDMVKTFEIPQGADLKSVLSSIHWACLDSFIDAYYSEQHLNYAINSLYADIDLLNSMKVLDTTNDEGTNKAYDEKRNAHIEKIYDVIEYVKTCGAYLNKLESEST